MNIHKQVATTALLLMLFATVGAAIVGLTFDNTIEDIKYNEKLTLLRKLNSILPAEKYDNDLLKDSLVLSANILLGTDENTIAYRARQQGKPVAIVLPTIAPNGYNGPIHMLVGINVDGTVEGVRIVKHRETPGLGDAIEAERSDWVLGFNGKSLLQPVVKKWKVKRDGGEFDQFTGATITPRAVVTAVHSTLLYFQNHHERLFKSTTSTNTDKTTTPEKKVES